MIWTIVLLVLAGLGIVLTPISILLVRELFLMSIEKDGLRMKLLQASTKALPQETPSDVSLSRPYRTLGENGDPPALPTAGPRKFRNGELVCELTRWQYLRFLRRRAWDTDPEGVIVRVGDELLRNAGVAVFVSKSKYDFEAGPDGLIVHQNDSFFRLDGKVVSRGRCIHWHPHEHGVLRVVDYDEERKFWLNDVLLGFVYNRPECTWRGGIHLSILLDGGHNSDGINLVQNNDTQPAYRKKSGEGGEDLDWFENYPDRLVIRMNRLVLLHELNSGREQVLYNGPNDGVSDHPDGIVVRRGRRFYFFDGDINESDSER